MFNQFIETIAAGDIQAIVSSTLGQIILFVLALILFVVIAAISKQNGSFKTKQMVFTAIAIALATVLSNIKLLELPQGGSVTPFSMLFIILIGHWYGTKTGLLAGLVYGLLQLAFGGWVMHPIQLLLDYPIAYAALGLSGIFRNTEGGLHKGLIFAIFGRFICHFITGYIFFASYAPEGMSPVLYSLMYNISYLAVEGFLTGLLLTIPAVNNAMKIVKKMATEEV